MTARRTWPQNALPKALNSSSLFCAATRKTKPDTKRKEGATRPFRKFRLLNQPVCRELGVEKRVEHVRLDHDEQGPGAQPVDEQKAARGLRGGRV